MCFIKKFLSKKKIYHNGTYNKIMYLFYITFFLCFIYLIPIPILSNSYLTYAKSLDTTSSNTDFLNSIDFYLLTVEKRTAPHLMFGHSVIRIKDNFYGTDTVVNWGIFDFDDPNFLIKFLKGNLYYSVEAYNFRSQLISWKKQGSSVYQDKLNLSINQKKLLLEKIQNNLKPDNKYFIYSYFKKNCATYPRDYIDDILKGNLKKKLTDSNHITSLSYRKDSMMNLSLNPFVSMGVDLIFNSDTDKPISVWERMYKPSTLREVLITEKNPELLDSSLLIEPSLIVEGNTPGPYPISGYAILTILFTIIILLYYIFNHIGKTSLSTKTLGIYSIGIGCLSTFASVFFIFFWGFTYQTDCKHNVNLFLLWPTDFIYIILGIKLLFSKTIKINKFISFYSLTHIISSILLLFIYIIGTIKQDISNVLLYLYPILIIFYCLTLTGETKNVFRFKK